VADNHDANTTGENLVKNVIRKPLQVLPTHPTRIEMVSHGALRNLIKRRHRLIPEIVGKPFTHAKIILQRLIQIALHSRMKGQPYFFEGRFTRASNSS